MIHSGGLLAPHTQVHRHHRLLRVVSRAKAKEIVSRAKAKEEVSRAKDPVAPRRPRVLRSRARKEEIPRKVPTKEVPPREVPPKEALTRASAAPRPLLRKEKEDLLPKEDLLKARAVAMFAMSKDFDRTAYSQMNA